MTVPLSDSDEADDVSGSEAEEGTENPTSRDQIALANPRKDYLKPISLYIRSTSWTCLRDLPICSNSRVSSATHRGTSSPKPTILRQSCSRKRRNSSSSPSPFLRGVTPSSKFPSFGMHLKTRAAYPWKRPVLLTRLEEAVEREEA